MASAAAPAAGVPTDSEQHQAPSVAAVSGHLEQVLAQAVPTEPEVEHLWACLNELRHDLAWMGRAWRLAPFGSVMNLLLTRGSDVDITIYRSDLMDEGNANAAVRVLQERVMDLLRSSPRFEIVGFVPLARVPVVNLRYNHAVLVDLSAHNTEPLRNSRLLRAYALAFPLMRGLALLVKLWAKSNHVSGADHMNLSSYALTLMVVYFLQVHPDFRMPVLPTHEFDGFRNPTMVDLCTDSALYRAAVPSGASTGIYEALLNFFTFYNETFEWGREVVSVRVGQRLPDTSDPFKALRLRNGGRLHIEDPFLVQRNLRGRLNQVQEGRLRAAMRAAEAALRGGGLPAGLDGAEADRAAPPAALIAPPLQGPQGAVQFYASRLVAEAARLREQAAEQGPAAMLRESPGGGSSSGLGARHLRRNAEMFGFEGDVAASAAEHSAPWAHFGWDADETCGPGQIAELVADQDPSGTNVEANLVLSDGVVSATSPWSAQTDWWQ